MAALLPDPQPNWRDNLKWVGPIIVAGMIAWGASQALLTSLDRRVSNMESAKLGEHVASIEAKLDILLRQRGLGP